MHNNLITLAFMNEITPNDYSSISSLISQLLTNYESFETGIFSYEKLIKSNNNARKLADLSTFYDTFTESLSCVEHGRVLLMNGDVSDSLDYFLDGVSESSLYLDLKGSLIDVIKKNIDKLKEEVEKAINKYDIKINKTEIFELLGKLSTIIENQSNANDTAIYDLLLNITSNIDRITQNINASIHTQYISKVHTFNYTLSSLVSRLPAVINNSEEFIDNLNSIVNSTLQNLITKLSDWDFSTAMDLGQFLDIALCNATIYIYTVVGQKLVNATAMLNNVTYLIYNYLSSSGAQFLFDQLSNRLANITLMISQLNSTRDYDDIVGNLSEIVLMFAQVINSSVGGFADDFSDVVDRLNYISSHVFSVSQDNISELSSLRSLLLQVVDLIDDGRFDIGLQIFSSNAANVEEAIYDVISLNYQMLDRLRRKIIQGYTGENVNLTSLLTRLNNVRLTLQVAEVALENSQYKLALSNIEDAESQIMTLNNEINMHQLHPTILTPQESVLMLPFVLIGVNYFIFFIIALTLITLIGSVVVARYHKVLTQVTVEDLQPPIQPPTFKPKSKAIRKTCPNYREYNGIHICTSTFPPSIITEKIAKTVCQSPTSWPSCKPILSGLPLTEKFDPENICSYLRVYKDGALFKFACSAKNIELNKDFAKLVCVNHPTWKHCPYYKEIELSAPEVEQEAPPQPVSENVCPFAEYNPAEKQYICRVSSQKISEDEFQTLCSKNFELCLLYKQAPPELKKGFVEVEKKEEEIVENVVEDSILNAPNRCEYLTKDSRGFVCTLIDKVVTEFEVNSMCSKEFHTMCRIYQTRAQKKDKSGGIAL